MYRSMTDTATLQNSVKIPCLGAGVFKVGNAVTAEVVQNAIGVGYRLIDTAVAYSNEEGVGEGLRRSGIKREDIFVTTKLANIAQGHDSAINALDESLQRLGMDYVDLYLIHWPIPPKDLYVETWKAFEKLYKSGKARAIGVSNFQIPHLQRLADECEITPMLNQVEFHPYLIQDDLIQYMQDNKIVFQAWSPLAKGKALTDPVILEIAGRYGKNPAQIVLRWSMQRGALVIPKTTSRERMVDNAKLFDFELADEDIQAINALHCSLRTGPDPYTFGV